MFRRRKGANQLDDTDTELGVEPGTEVDSPDDESQADERPPTPPARPQGPWDVADAPEDGLTRLDLGGLRLPGFDGMEIQVNLDEATGSVIAVTAVDGDSALQLQPFAAPRNEGIWAEVRREIAAEISRDGGLADVVEDDEFGGTLRARLSAPQADGSTSLQSVRFIGVDGPRWFLRGVLTGRAAVEPEAAQQLLSVFRGAIVVRGNDPHAPRDPIALRLPQDAAPTAPTDEVAKLTDLDPGPTIAEIR